MQQWTEEEKYLLGHVLPGIASQLRAPLNNIALAMQRVLPREDKDCSQELAILQQSYYRMLRLVSHLGQASELLEDAPLPKENVEVCSFFRELCYQAQELFAEKDVSLSFLCDVQDHVTALNAEAVRRMLWHLLSNALKYTPKGGEVSVSLRFSAGQLLLGISDNGPGIPQEDMDKIFDRWHHAEENIVGGEGFGLGLPLCRHIARRQGGRLLLGERPQGGISVTVSLPDEQVSGNRIRQRSFDFAGGFEPVLLELSDALPYTAFCRDNLDQ